MKHTAQVIRKKRYKAGLSEYNPESTRTGAGANCSVSYSCV